MFNPLTETNWKPGLKERKQFAISLVLGLPAVGLVLLLAGWLFKGHWQANLPIALSFAGTGLGLGGLLWAVPQIARPFYVAWYFVTGCLGFVVGTLVLAAFFYFVLTPLGLAKRCFGKPSIRKQCDRTVSTYWEDAGPPPEPEQYFKQF
ncbi:MAG TPA: hypothetical protein VF988_10045 [Verrucomicrobiae bacterium]